MLVKIPGRYLEKYRLIVIHVLLLVNDIYTSIETLLFVHLKP